MTHGQHDAPDSFSALEAMNRYLDEEASRPPDLLHAHHGPMESVREASHNGHKIVVRTTYVIEVDGREFSGHLYVSNSGEVQFHGLPNYSFASAIDLMKKVIDAFPQDFEPPPDGHGGHGHGGGHGESGHAPSTHDGHQHEGGV